MKSLLPIIFEENRTAAWPVVLDVKQVNKRFGNNGSGGITVLQDISFRVRRGEFVCILGRSGCGKSTLLKILAGFIPPTTGVVQVNGRTAGRPGPDRCVVFQEDALFGWLTVRENIAFGLMGRAMTRREKEKEVDRFLSLIGLTDFANYLPAEISGGMKQRVSLARVLILKPEVLLMDEPFAALDSQTKNILQQELQHIWWETKKTIVFVTHNVEEAVLLADRVIVMSANPGQVKKEFPIELARPRQPENVDLAYLTAGIMRELKEEVEKVAKAEFDHDWNIKKDTILPDPNSHMGIGL